MASYISVPRDLARVKTKAFFGLTRRQLVCFGAAAAVGLPAFFLLRRAGNASLAALGMIAAMLPLFFLAMYEKDGQPLETVIRHAVTSMVVRPRVRPYRTDNYYAALMRQYDAEEEVRAIVRKAEEREGGRGESAPALGPDGEGEEDGGGRR